MTAELWFALASLVLNAVQAMWVNYLKAKYRVSEKALAEACDEGETGTP